MLLSSLFLFIEQPKTIIFIVFILVLFFGAKRIPELFRGLGQGVREFKDASRPDQEQPMNPNGYAAPNNTNYPPQAAPYGQPVAPQQYPAQHAPGAAPVATGYAQATPTVPVTPAPYNPNNTPAS